VPREPPIMRILPIESWEDISGVFVCDSIVPISEEGVVESVEFLRPSNREFFYVRLQDPCPSTPTVALDF
jgi:hypothetical protein